MVGVTVREQNGVDTGQAMGESLLPQVRRGVDQNRRAVVDVDDDRGPAAAVALLLIFRLKWGIIATLGVTAALGLALGLAA